MEIMDNGAETLGLSLREMEVLNRTAEGKTNLEISSILGIRERTVEKHLESVYKKLGVNTRTGAVILFLNKDVSHGATAEPVILKKVRR